MNCDVPALWQEHKEALFFFILKRVRDESTAKDISQEVLIKVYNFCKCKSGVRNIRSWLYQIASNAIADHYRKNKNQVVTDTFNEAEIEDERSAMQDAAEFVLPMINLLPEQYAAPLRMSDVEGINLKDIGEEMGLGLSAVKQRVSRGRKMLKEIFTECCLVELNEDGRLVSFDIRPQCGALQRYKASLENIK
jgi:RNA polymerase sigma-70 factor (ECF subfamily)